MKYLLSLSLVLTVGFYAFGQNQKVFKFEDKSQEISEEKVQVYGPEHYLGPKFTEELTVLLDRYTYTPAPTPMNPTPARSTEKPAIYNSLKKLDKYYKKQLKKGLISKPDAEKALQKVINITYSVRFEETDELEKILWKTKNPVDLNDLFMKRIVLTEDNL